MAEEEQPDRWEQVLDILSDTIRFKSRADAGGWDSAFEQAKTFVQVSRARSGGEEAQGSAPGWPQDGPRPSLLP